MGTRSEIDAAYFTWIRATEERDALLAYRDWLVEEVERLDAVATSTRERTEALPRQLRRPVGSSDKSFLEAVGRRRTIVLSEQLRIDERIAAAEAFVAETQATLDALRGS